MKKNSKLQTANDIKNHKQLTGNFILSVEGISKKSTDYFSKMAKISAIILNIDRYLLSIFPGLKTGLYHQLQVDTIGDQLAIMEIINFEDEFGDYIKVYLRNGKEIILSSICTIKSEEDIELLFQRLSTLANLLDQKLTDTNFLENMSCKYLQKVDFARLLNELHRFFNEAGKSTNITMLSVAGSPAIKFNATPKLLDWIEYTDDIQPHAGLFSLLIPNLECNKSWKGRLLGVNKEKNIDITINDIKYLEGLKSSKSNEPNGILIGDILKARYVGLNPTFVQPSAK